MRIVHGSGPHHTRAIRGIAGHPAAWSAVNGAPGPPPARLPGVDEYQLEIQSLRRQLAKLKADKAEPALIEEHEAELRNLVALYDAATAAFAAGGDDARVADALLLLGFGGWSFDNVYSFVYDAAMETDPGDLDLANVITHTDYAASLLLALDAQ